MSTPRHGRYGYSALPDRPVYDWPGGKRLAVYLGLNLETFDFGSGRGAQLAPGGGDPDVLNYAWRDWGNRVGAWRLLETLDALCLPTSVIANSRVFTDCPGLVEAFLARGDELVGHGRTNAERQADLTEDDERALIAEVTAELTARAGHPPAGWLGPWISQSDVTPDLLAEAGYSYLLDWSHDDQPTWFATRGGGRVLSVPYPQELNDIPAVVARQVSGPEFADMVVATFDEMLEQSRSAPLVMGIALHPYVVGQPHRLRPLRAALQHVAAHRDDVWLTTAGAIARHAASPDPGT
ncbi:polysaccharide deacetylase family protein [Modestobacter sp. Leaf380]|uniref:polysaccharide deacetylase family protein n=1 Tax=Modestobacter sp. Leaf380 TaxID=1736356 RepID=UPI0006F660AA|nr:polysaccharide deacetylase family protein [Modestobacter sp. Leaf380]KQS69372.1 polysaccharide deacetylase [Modestobacter sp. Leaf380]